MNLVIVLFISKKRLPLTNSNTVKWLVVFYYVLWKRVVVAVVSRFVDKICILLLIEMNRFHEHEHEREHVRAECDGDIRTLISFFSSLTLLKFFFFLSINSFPRIAVCRWARTQSNKTPYTFRCSHSSWVAYPSIFSNHMTLHGQESSMMKWMNEKRKKNWWS